MTNDKDENPNETKFLLFQSDDGAVHVNVRLEGETVWLTQKAMALLFDVESHTITYHLKEIYQSAELQELATTRKFRVVQREGNRDVSRELDFYNLDAIIAVGYRVNSKRATQFRIWATSILKEYIIKGFALNDERMKTGRNMTYFDELQARIREIRLSERFFYQRRHTHPERTRIADSRRKYQPRPRRGNQQPSAHPIPPTANRRRTPC